MIGEPANPYRGEARLVVDGTEHVLRPTFAALVAVEEELGALLPLVERAAAGQIRLAELVALFWHCLRDREGMERACFAEAVTRRGLAACSPALRVILGQILQGAG